ncbi:histidine kinase dimerization/phospho-acceptor domain-containing protein [Microvirgula aerodenitrificans]|uniref:histidine kinase dimerization/phospho-acceptor domain-containing protein n=1 Tax=Microvirgula aerodenitrificans TaxID=57480 RepID=UPI0035711D7B
MSHEIRTPLARLSFELDILRREEDPVARLALIERWSVMCASSTTWPRSCWPMRGWNIAARR